MKSNLSIESQAQQLVYDDEISLRDILLVLIRQRKIILLVSLFVVVVTILYALLASPVYQVKASFLPPTNKDVAVLNIEGVSEIKKDELYTAFERQLNSISLRRDVFDDKKIFSELDGENEDLAFEKYFETLKVVKKKVKKGGGLGIMSLTLDGGDSEEMVDVINTIVTKANQKAVRGIVDGIVFSVNNKTSIAQLEVDLLRKDLREKLIEIDNEKVTLAKEAGLLKNKVEPKEGVKKNIVLTENAPASVSDKNDNSSILLDIKLRMRLLEFNLENKNTFSKKEQFKEFENKLQERKDKLQERKDKLQERKDKLQEKELELIKLKAIQLNVDDIKAASIEQLAYASGKKIKPKRSLIVAIGLLLGLILGVFLAFVVDSLQRNPLGDTST